MHIPSQQKCVIVIGDGSCYFRTLSLAISGAETAHAETKNLMISYTMTDRINLQLNQIKKVYIKHEIFRICKYVGSLVNF